MQFRMKDLPLMQLKQDNWCNRDKTVSDFRFNLPSFAKKFGWGPPKIVFDRTLPPSESWGSFFDDNLSRDVMGSVNWRLPQKKNLGKRRQHHNDIFYNVNTFNLIHASANLQLMMTVRYFITQKTTSFNIASKFYSFISFSFPNVRGSCSETGRCSSNALLHHIGYWIKQDQACNKS